MDALVIVSVSGFSFAAGMCAAVWLFTVISYFRQWSLHRKSHPRD